MTGVALATLGGRRDGDGVLDGAGGEQGPPVVQLVLTRDPRRRHDEQLGTGVDQRAAHLGKPQVVTGHQPGGHTADVDDHRLDVTRAQPVGLAVAEGVVEVDLAVRGGERPVRREDDQGVERQAVGALEHAGNDGCTEAAGLLGKRGHERPVQWLGDRREIVARGAELVHRRLGQHDEVGRSVETAQPGLDEHAVGCRVGARRQLHQGNTHHRHCFRSWLRAP
jgi:hypothetical protein